MKILFAYIEPAFLAGLFMGQEGPHSTSTPDLGTTTEMHVQKEKDR